MNGCLMYSYQDVNLFLRKTTGMNTAVSDSMKHELEISENPVPKITNRRYPSNQRHITLLVFPETIVSIKE